MDRKINVLGLSIDNISIHEIMSRVFSYLEDDYVNTIVTLFPETVIEIMENEEFKKTIQTADTILLGDKMISEADDIPESFIQPIITSDILISEILALGFKQSISVFLIAKDEQQVKFFQEYLLKLYPTIKCKGAFDNQILLKPEIVINEINSVNPDILFVALETPNQEQWIVTNKNQLNTKLCVGIGNALYKLSKNSPVELENGLKSDGVLSIENIGKSIKNISVGRNFKKKVEQYKNKKGEDE